MEADMAISSIQAAWAQYDASLPWEQSQEAALSALEALEYIYARRAQTIAGGSLNVSYERIETELAAIRRYLGYDARAARGSRWRRVR